MRRTKRLPSRWGRAERTSRIVTSPIAGSWVSLLAKKRRSGVSAHLCRQHTILMNLSASLLKCFHYVGIAAPTSASLWKSLSVSRRMTTNEENPEYLFKQPGVILSPSLSPPPLP